jgi:hypothetical protein
MRPGLLICSLLGAVTAATAAPSSSDTLLGKLADDLRRARASGEVAPTFARCPEDSSSLRGVTRSTVFARLGGPDWCAGDGLVEADCDDSPTATYFFTGKPRDPILRGGGFPELQFRFGRDDTVKNVECHRSR